MQKNNKMTVLLVEDEAFLRRELEETFSWESVGCSIIASVGTVVHALEAMECYRPDILVTDIKLPDGDGLSLVEETQPRAAIVITGHAQIAYAQKALRAGAADFLLKPLDDAELRHALRRAVKKLGSAGIPCIPKKKRGSKSCSGEQVTPLVQESLLFLRRHYSRNIGLFEAAQDIGISEGHLASIFKAETGLTFMQALTNYRLEQACMYLRDPRFQVSEVARLCGFNDPAYFAKVFKRNCGCTPREFKDNPL
jgi:two-component system, response regulator YesN